MPFRLRKSFKIAPGLRATVTPKGVSARIGGRNAGVNVGKRGVTASVSAPGTGVGYSTRIGGASQRAASGRCCGLFVLLFLVATAITIGTPAVVILAAGW